MQNDPVINVSMSTAHWRISSLCPFFSLPGCYEIDVGLATLNVFVQENSFICDK